MVGFKAFGHSFFPDGFISEMTSALSYSVIPAFKAEYLHLLMLL